MSIGPVTVTRGLTVAVGLSGGVDSTVAALLLRNQGADVVGVHMSNWEAPPAEGGEADGRPMAEQCSMDTERDLARRVCAQLRIPFREVRFREEYWQDVVAPYTAGTSAAVTPNLDLNCNRHIKFGALHAFCMDRAGDVRADAVATGHFARLSGNLAGRGGGAFRRGSLPPSSALGGGSDRQLLRGADHRKDQSYFLASAHEATLQNALFPLGNLTKERVRRIASSHGLCTALRPSTKGVCMIGRGASHRSFVSEHVPPRPGPVLCVDSGRLLGGHDGAHLFTTGQRLRLRGWQRPWFVAGRGGADGNDVYACMGEGHPALFRRRVAIVDTFWVRGAPPAACAGGMPVPLTYKANSSQTPLPCTLSWTPGTPGTPDLTVSFPRPAGILASGQALVLYDGDVCLGGGMIAADVHL